jgi:hypothetical protein
MNEGVGDILKATEAKSTQKQKIEYLQKMQKKYPHIISFLKYMFKNDIRFDLPAGPVEDGNGKLLYRPQNKESDLQNVLYSKLRKMKVFMRGEYPGMSKAKREAQFIELLESVDPDDAIFIIAMKDKKSPYKGITKALIQKAFPKETENW